MSTPMKITCIATVLLATSTVTSRALGDDATWPPNAAPGGSYTISREESTLFVSKIRLPDDFTLRVAPDVTRVAVFANELEFGRNSTIDLTPPMTKPPRGANGGSGSQPPWGQKGRPGGAGQPGVAARPTASLDLTVYSVVSSAGSLWIRTDGAPGGDGGDGGAGGKGGGSSCGTRNNEPHTDAGPGGDGGRGGAGAKGGDTARVKMIVRSVSPDPMPIGTCGTPGVPSTRPSGADVGQIMIYGSPGAGGSGGRGGDAGPGDHGRGCQWFVFGPGDVRGSGPGAAGAPGANGAPGTCTEPPAPPPLVTIPPPVVPAGPITPNPPAPPPNPPPSGPTMTVFFDGGTAVGGPIQTRMTVTNLATGVSRARVLSNGLTSSGCATNAWLLAGEAGLRAEGVGFNGVRFFGRSQISVTGGCQPMRCDVPNCSQ